MQIQGYTELKVRRYERKFLPPYICRGQVESLLMRNSFAFRKAYSPRQVNNIYFDTPGFDCYYANLFGIGYRWKVRIRWYGNLFGNISNPVLELKIKHGYSGSKKSFMLSSMTIDKDHFDGSKLMEMFENESIPEEIRLKLESLQPVLLNSYLRSYFVSGNGLFRATVDDQLSYYQVRLTWNQFHFPMKEENKTVLEIKYNMEYDDQAPEITRQFPFRMEKNSKFVSGMSLFKGDIPL